MHYSSLIASALFLATTVLAFSVSPKKTTTFNSFPLYNSKIPDTMSLSSSAANKFRSVRKVLPRPSRHWVGTGFHVYPVFADLAFTKEVSPLLMFDYAAPTEFPARTNGAPPLGVGQHPHRGFETVTVAFQGEVEHHDSTGKNGVIKEGDVQWMTAGRGIIHQEYHSKDFTREGGMFEFCQLWVNLPKKYKMTKPGYQPIRKSDIPVVPLPVGIEAGSDKELGTARLIAGELSETTGAASTFSPVQMWDVSLPQQGSTVDLPFPADHNCIVFVRQGGVEVLSGDESNDLGASTLGPQDVALMHMDGSTSLRLRVTEPDTSVMILGGEPIDEPIAAHGPFVMNEQEEIGQAFMDFSMGRMGQ